MLLPNQIEQNGKLCMESFLSLLPKTVNLHEKMKEMFPVLEVFAVVRNPVDRAYSDFNRSIQKCEIEKLRF